MSRITLTSPLTTAEREAVQSAIDLDEAVPSAITALLVELRQANTAADSEFRMYAEWFDVNPDAAGTEWTSRGKRYRLTGFAPNSPKYPILAVELDGTKRGVKFTREAAKSINAAYDRAHGVKTPDPKQVIYG